MLSSESMLATVRRAWDDVIRELGVSYSEFVYQQALAKLLREQKIPVQTEVLCPIWFHGECIGVGRADVVVPGFVFELKAMKPRRRALHTGYCIASSAEQQVAAYSQSLSLNSGAPVRGVVLRVADACASAARVVKQNITSDKQQYNKKKIPPRPTLNKNDVDVLIAPLLSRRFKSVLNTGSSMRYTSVLTVLVQGIEKQLQRIGIPVNSRGQQLLRCRVQRFLDRSFETWTQSVGRKRVKMCTISGRTQAVIT